MKTGSLRDVAFVAGCVLAESGRRFVGMAIINHPNAARPALDALTYGVGNNPLATTQAVDKRN
jgi:D-alanyl-D-alanine carboxypeptidase/D-alanyl-D-alanine-endopeptidase (penicillin-binding protein 4)